MLKTQTPKQKYFYGRADAARKAIARIDKEISEYQYQVKNFPTSKHAPRLRQMIADLEKKRRDLNREVSRHLFNAGRS